jgi:hypothetical protein
MQKFRTLQVFKTLLQTCVILRILLLQADLSPQEMKIKDLEKNITETTEKCEELQQLWLRQQTRLVRLAHQRNQQLRNINLIHKRKQK